MDKALKKYFDTHDEPPNYMVTFRDLYEKYKETTDKRLPEPVSYTPSKKAIQNINFWTRFEFDDIDSWIMCDDSCVSTGWVVEQSGLNGPLIEDTYNRLFDTLIDLLTKRAREHIEEVAERYKLRPFADPMVNTLASWVQRKCNGNLRMLTRVTDNPFLNDPKTEPLKERLEKRHPFPWQEDIKKDPTKYALVPEFCITKHMRKS